MSEHADQAIDEARQVLKDLAGFLRAVGETAPHSARSELDLMAARVEGVAAEHCRERPVFARLVAVK